MKVAGRRARLPRRRRGVWRRSFAAAPALLSAVKRPTTRATESKDLIATFVFAIPKARAAADDDVFGAVRVDSNGGGAR